MGILIDILEKKDYLNGKDNEEFHVSISDSFKEYIQDFLKKENERKKKKTQSNKKSWIQNIN